MLDAYGRRLHYLRISVTDRCNLRCRYCMPEKGVHLLAHDDILRYDEILRVVRVMASLGVDRVRLTGGEPLVRRGLADLAADIKGVQGIAFLGLTTNGVQLEDQAEHLLAAGVDGLNISLDTLNPAQYREITRCGELASALAGLHKALELGFPSVKINCVLAPDSTPEDWLGVVGLAKSLPVDVRLIEWMPLADGIDAAGVGAKTALERISREFGAPERLPTVSGEGPARYWRIPGFAGRLGIIHAMSHDFCDSCNRLRLTPTGNLKLCLFYDSGVALKPLLRGDADDAALANAIMGAVGNKPRRHSGMKKRQEDGSDGPLIERTCGMYDLGG